MKGAGLKTLIINTFKSNHEVFEGQNPNVVFLVGFTDNHIDLLLKNVQIILTKLPRTVKVVNAEGLTYRKLMRETY
jgi:hypothetical protein